MSKIEETIKLLSLEFKNYEFYIDKSKKQDKLNLEVSADYEYNNDMDIITISGTKEELLDIITKIKEAIEKA